MNYNFYFTPVRFLFKILAFLILILLSITSFFIIKGNQELHQELKKLSDQQHKMIFDADLGYRLKNNERFTWDTYSNQAKDSNIVVTIDSFYRRITHLQDTATRHLITLGCSYTFGQGLNDDETIPYLISERANKYQVYNYALPGYGAQQILSIFNKPIEDEIHQDTGILLYFFIDHHLNRLVRDLFTIRYNFYTPYYKLNHKNELINCGFYYKHKSLLTRFVLGLAAYPRLFTVAMRIEPKFRKVNTAHNYTLLAKIVAASQTAYLDKFPNGKYYVVIFPSEDNTAKKYFEKEGIEVIDLSSQLNLDKIDGRQIDGYHPNVKGAEAIANLTVGIIDSL